MSMSKFQSLTYLFVRFRKAIIMHRTSCLAVGAVALLASVTSLSAEAQLLYVSYSDSRVRVLDSSGTVLKTIGNNFTASEAYGIAFDGTGSMFVATTSTQAISKFDKNGNFLTSFGSPTTSNRPIGVAIDSSGNVYTGNMASSISKFDGNGAYLSSFGNSYLSIPYGLAFDSTGNLYAAGAGIGQIVKFNSAGVFQQVIYGGGLDP